MTRKIRPSEVADRLDRAADLIMERGWLGTPPTARNQDRLCAGMAIQEATRSRERSWVVIRTFRKYLDGHQGHPGGIVKWNDSQRDRRKVVRHLRKCARLVRAHKLEVIR